jgi:AcrR family transcriptional regulator
VKRRGRPPRAAAPAEGVEGRILDSACHLFYKEGLRATGIERVLAGAGAAKASLYSHYGSKDELVRAYLERIARDWIARVETRVSPGDGRAGLLRLFDMISELVASETFRGCPFLNAASELTDREHPGRVEVRRQREWLHGLVRGLLASAGVRDVERVARSVIVLHDGAIASAVLDGDVAAPAAARFAVERLLEGSPAATRRGDSPQRS